MTDTYTPFPKDHPSYVGQATGLAPLRPDERDFHHSIVFGALAKDEIPTHDFFVSHPLVIKNQLNYQFCRAFALSSVVEDQVDIELDPVSAYAWMDKLLGVVNPNGGDLRSACEEAIKIGLITQELAPFKIDANQPPEFLADWVNYSEDLLAVAWEHARVSYFRCDTGPHDTFDNIRAALFQNIDEHRSILTGCAWHKEWTYAPQGLVPDDITYTSEGDGHAIKVFGQMQFPGENEPRLVVQNSWGDQLGDKGIYYFPRSVVNKEFTYGAYNFKNLAPAKAAFYAQNGISVNAGFWAKAYAVIISIIKSYL